MVALFFWCLELGYTALLHERKRLIFSAPSLYFFFLFLFFFSLDAMDQTRQTLQDILGYERGHQEQLQRDIMAYVWTHLGGHQFEQETYRKNLALLESMNKQQKRTGGHLQWILLELTEFEAELEMLWERMADAGVIEAQEGARKGQSQGQGKGRGTAKRANGKKKTTISLQDEIDQIETVTNNLKARKVPVF